MNVTQCRMARAALGWSLDELAAASGVARRTIARFEAGKPIQADNAAALRQALEKAGIVFVDGAQLAGALIPPQA